MTKTEKVIIIIGAIGAAVILFLCFLAFQVAWCGYASNPGWECFVDDLFALFR